jgi:hypothetical protein
MKAYVSTTSANPILDAVIALEDLGFQEDSEGREYFIQATTDGSFEQVYDDGEVIEWGSPETKLNTLADKIEVTFFC